jgi:hypothetical protein
VGVPPPSARILAGGRSSSTSARASSRQYTLSMSTPADSSRLAMRAAPALETGHNRMNGSVMPM